MSVAESALQEGPLRRFKPYPAYKDSEIEWLGEIPAHWEVKPLKAASMLQTGLTLGKDYQRKSLVARPYLRVANVQDGYLNLDDIAEVELPENDAIRYELCQGDVLMTEGGDFDKLGRGCVWENQVPQCLHQNHIFAVRPCLRQLSPEFLALMMSSSYGRAYFTATSKQSTNLASTNSTKLRNFPLPLPSESEQCAIATFLNRETDRIDALVAKKQRLIGLLQEQRTSLITRAVTKGLDPTVAMKDSGVEWLGEIPEHWEPERIKWAAKIVSGHTPDKKIEAYWKGGDIPWVSLADTGQLREVDYIGSTAALTTAEGIANSSAHVLPTGTVVFSRDATIGLCAITQGEMAVSQHFIGWVCSNRLRPEYLLLVLRAMREELDRLTMGATVRTIGMPDVKSLAIPLPPLQEQVKIVNDALRFRAEMDQLVFKIKKAINHLKELRTALISAAVTGKIDVREAQP